MSVFMLCERAVGLIKGKRLILSTAERAMLDALNYEWLTTMNAQAEAAACARHFASVRDGLLGTYPWVFARRSTIDSSSSSSLYGWAYSYTLPPDCMKLLQIVLEHGTVPRYEQVGNVVGCDHSGIGLRYTARITDTEQWPMLFQDAFCARLASEMCFGVTGSQGGDALFQQYQFFISEGYRVGIIDPGVQLNAEMFKQDNAETPAGRSLAGKLNLNGR